LRQSASLGTRAPVEQPQDPEFAQLHIDASPFVVESDYSDRVAD
jgi:hypothetical protein